MQDSKDPQQKLRELERLREQALKQLPYSYGSVRDELLKVVADVDAEIAGLRRDHPDVDL